jgi:hypothetical protein
VDIPTHVDAALTAALEQWTDQRVITQDDLFDLLLFMVHHTAVFVNSGYHPTGFSFRQRNGQTLMCVKCTQNELPLVVFVTAENPTGCIRRLWDLWVNDRLVWVKDKYAAI